MHLTVCLCCRRIARRPLLWSPPWLPLAPLPQPPTDWTEFFQHQEQQLQEEEDEGSISSGFCRFLPLPPGVATPAEAVGHALLSEDLSEPMSVLHALRQYGVPRRRLIGRRRATKTDEMPRLVVHIVEPCARQCLGVGRWSVLFTQLAALRSGVCPHFHLFLPQCTSICRAFRLMWFYFARSVALLFAGRHVRPDMFATQRIPQRLKERLPDPEPAPVVDSEQAVMFVQPEPEPELQPAPAVTPAAAAAPTPAPAPVPAPTPTPAPEPTAASTAAGEDTDGASDPADGPTTSADYTALLGLSPKQLKQDAGQPAPISPAVAAALEQLRLFADDASQDSLTFETDALEPLERNEVRLAAFEIHGFNAKSKGSKAARSTNTSNLHHNMIPGDVSLKIARVCFQSWWWRRSRRSRVNPWRQQQRHQRLLRRRPCRTPQDQTTPRASCRRVIQKGLTSLSILSERMCSLGTKWEPTMSLAVSDCRQLSCRDRPRIPWMVPRGLLSSNRRRRLVLQTRRCQARGPAQSVGMFGGRWTRSATIVRSRDRTIRSQLRRQNGRHRCSSTLRRLRGRNQWQRQALARNRAQNLEVSVA